MKFNDIKLSFGIIYVGLIVLFTLFSLYLGCTSTSETEENTGIKDTFSDPKPTVDIDGRSLITDL